MEWKEYRLSQLLTIKNGKDYKSLPAGDIPVFGSGGYMCSVNSSLYNDESILLPRKGTLTNIQYYNGPFWTVDTCFYSIVKKELAVPYFLYLYLKNLDFSGFDTGASIPSMTTTAYYAIRLKLPPLEYQQEIANTVKNYDTLIDINTKRIKLLEDSARDLYKEWFVRMRFPGHEQTKFVKGIPEGWKVKELKELVSTQYGLTTTTHNEKVDNDAYYLRITDIVDNNIDWSSVPYCTINDTIMERFKLYPGDILVARTGATVGYATQIQKIPYNAVFASYLIRLNAKNSIHSSYIGLSVVSDVFKDYIQSIATGAAQPMANPRLMTTFKLLLPDDELLKKFNEKVDLVNNEILTLQLQNQSLTATRDRLLPRLLSGELKINA